MSDFSQQDSVVTPQFVHTFGMQSALFTARPQVASLGNGANITWVANHAVFMPMVLPWPYPVRRVWWINGTTTSTNADFGIYGWDGKKVYSTGSTAMAGGVQYVDPTDFLLPAGRYYFAWTCDNTTTRVRGWTTVTALIARGCGILQQGTALPLPADMSSAVAATQALYPECGITRTASGFA